MANEFLSRRALELEPSATMAMNARAKKLMAEGKNVLSFSVGEPDFKTPGHICEAAKAAIDNGFHGYSDVPGTLELRKAIAASLKRSTGVSYEPTQIVASPGAKYSIYLTLLALVNPGDEVIIPSPCWVSYPEMVRLAGGVPVIVPTREEDNFAVSAAAIEKAVTPKTKLLILNSPSNPTGQVVPPAIVSEIGAVLEKKGVWCLADEIYNELVFGGAEIKSIASVSEYCRDHTVVVNGCSKTYAMTGWRMGWIGARAELARAISDLQGQTCSNPSTIAQAAAVAALTGSMDTVYAMRKEFAKRRDIIHELLNAIPGFKLALPQGAFYALPNISGVLGKTVGGVTVKTPTDFCNVALDKALVAAVPGEAFGAYEHIRLSYATSEENIREGCRRLKELVEGATIPK